MTEKSKWNKIFFFKRIVLAEFLFLMLFFGLTAVLCLSIYKNISYPLLWNDEGYNAMYARRILTYGYPKVHDGKNVLNLYEGLDVNQAINARYDAFLFNDWAAYYFGAIGEYFSRFSQDIYTQTALLRIPFATAGLLGLGLLAYTFLPFFTENTLRRYLYLSLFTLQSLLSIPLILHFRQDQYYPLVLLITAAILFVYVRHNFLHQYSKKLYNFSLSTFLVLLYLIFHPGYFIFLAILGFWIALSFCLEHIKIIVPQNFLLRDIHFVISTPVVWKKIMSSLAPLIISFVCILPIAIFFRHFTLANIIAAQYGFSLKTQTRHVIAQISYFYYWGFGGLAFLIKILLFFFLNEIRNKIDEKAWIFLKLSSFLSVLFLGYIVLVSRMPYIFQRYYINLQPLLAVIILLDIFLLFDLIKNIQSIKFNITTNLSYILFSRHLMIITSLLILGVFIFELGPVLHTVKQYYQELVVQYRGPLDYIIPYIRQNYDNTEKLVIATNYEEPSYMYYLNAKVTIGFVLNNVKEDMAQQPDIIIYRRGWPDKGKALYTLFQRGAYQEVAFPVLDYPVNNIPDTTFPHFTHLYETPALDVADGRSLRIYIKK